MRVLSLGVGSVPCDLQKWTSTTAHHHRTLANKLDKAIYVFLSDSVNKCSVLTEKSLTLALVPHNTNKNHLIQFLYYALKLGRKYDVDLIISQDIQLIGLLAFIVSKILRKPLLVNVLGPGIFSPYNNSNYGWNVKIFRKIAWFIQNRAKVVRTLNPLLKDFLHDNIGVSHDKIRIVSDRIDLNLFQPVKNHRKSKIIAFVGRLHPLKGIRYLIQALPSIIKKYPDLKCMIIGEGSYKDDLKIFISRLHVNDYVEFTGFIPHHNMPSLYHKMDLLVLPSIVEGQSRVVLEAMACGVPVIATKTGGVPALIEHGVNGYLVNPKNSEMIIKYTLRLLSDQKYAKQLSENALKIVQQYEMNHQLQRYYELFKLALLR